MMKVVRKEVCDFHLDHIFDCGQAFRWEKQEDGSYTGIAGNHIANVQFEPESPGGTCGTLILSNVTEEEYQSFWMEYLDLKRDYAEIKNTLAKDPVMAKAIKQGEGIRLLQQDPWEILLSFIISQNNHIPRIKKCIDSLCENFGEKAGEFQGNTYYTLPTPEKLAALTVEDLGVCRLGYRAKYLIASAQKVCEDGLDALYRNAIPQVTSKEAYDYVTGFHGVGPKVANCILLFSMGKYDRFPVDTWMKKVMEQQYGLSSVKAIEAFASENFGEYGGFAQQYLFYFVREEKE